MVLKLAMDSREVPFKVYMQTKWLCFAVRFRAGISTVVHYAVVFTGLKLAVARLWLYGQPTRQPACLATF